MANDSRSQLRLDVQYAIGETDTTAKRSVPTRSDFRRWVAAALSSANCAVEMVIRIVGEEESRQLNQRYRGKDKPTNILSFPFAAPTGVSSAHLGDLVICAPVVQREAREQQKKATDHWAHMVVHGVLHLLGWDHETAEQARVMEGLERRILAGLGIEDPYQFEDV
jgi:probable rRNA maturation factor